MNLPLRKGLESFDDRTKMDGGSLGPGRNSHLPVQNRHPVSLGNQEVKATQPQLFQQIALQSMMLRLEL